MAFDLLFGRGGNSNAKLRSMTISFFHHIIENAEEERLNSVGLVLLSALTKVVDEEKNKVHGST